MIRKFLNKLAARILRGQVTGFVVSAPWQSDPASTIEGWAYGDGWHIEFPSVRPIQNAARFTRLPASTLDGRP
jgi:hypothetical protein